MNQQSILAFVDGLGLPFTAGLAISHIAEAHTDSADRDEKLRAARDCIDYLLGESAPVEKTPREPKSRPVASNPARANGHKEKTRKPIARGAMTKRCTKCGESKGFRGFEKGAEICIACRDKASGRATSLAAAHD